MSCIRRAKLLIDTKIFTPFFVSIGFSFKKKVVIGTYYYFFLNESYDKLLNSRLFFVITFVMYA